MTARPKSFLALARLGLIAVNGRRPGEPGVKPFGNPVHCVRLARDGLLYVCDRANNRIQVFRTERP